MHISGHSKKLNQSHSKKHTRGPIERKGLKAFKEGQSVRRESIQNGHAKDALKAHSKGTPERPSKDPVKRGNLSPVKGYTKRHIRRVHGRSNRRIDTGDIQKPKLSIFIQISKEDKIPCFWPQLQNFIHGLENVCLWQLKFCLLVPSLLLYIRSMFARQKGHKRLERRCS